MVIRILAFFLCFWSIFCSYNAEGQCITIANPGPICPGSSAVLNATVQPGCMNGSHSYSFEQFSYLPEPFSGGIPVDPDMTNCMVGNAGPHDDCFSGPYNIGFTFCFFNQLYTQFWIGSNGWIGFSDPAGHDWFTYQATTLPNQIEAAPKNCIFAPWEDWYPTYSGTNNIFYYAAGTPGDRLLVVYWTNCPIYSCRNDAAVRGTFQIVLKEQGNVIENHIQNRPSCLPNTATQGVQNIDGLIAYTAPGRNNTIWNPEVVTNESTRFIPSGVTWYDLYPGGNILGKGDQLTVTPLATTTYYALFENCGDPPEVVQTTVVVQPLPDVIVGPGSSTVICSGQQANVLLSSSQAMATFAWTVPSLPPGITMGATSGSGDIHQVIQNSGASAATVVFSIIATANGCSSPAPTLYPVVVEPFLSVNINPASTASICSGQQANIFFSSNITGATFSWSVVPLPAGVTMSPTSGTGDVHQVIQNSANTPATVIFTVLGISVSCPNAPPVTYPVQVNPLPVVTYTACNDLITVSNGRKIVLRGGAPVSGSYLASEGVLFNAVTNSYEFDPSLVTGPFPKNITITYHYQNSWSCFGDKTQTITVSGLNADIVSPTIMKDLRDNQFYPYGSFGTGAFTRQWLTKNLNYGSVVPYANPQTNNCIAEKYCPPADPSCSGAGGGFYQWDEVMQYQDNTGLQDLCPPGWHIPTDSEWQLLIDNLDPAITSPSANAIIGLDMKDPGLPFQAVEKGFNYQNSNSWSFFAGNTATMFWTSSPSGLNKVIARGLNELYNPSVSYYPSSRSNAFSVRCIKN